ncbi:hypothetical protein BDV96DRAFT_571636 [Lophiotrema nucula]|uniref:Uncharacterized protein n=1 Tax=Lophiotrema nucula TaxID=690887 RepID=A0A6A5ZDY6_9PLEO|nr:hypothetical protein BDV96DRAFT_571636 [Lophiotrema nucula]
MPLRLLTRGGDDRHMRSSYPHPYQAHGFAHQGHAPHLAGYPVSTPPSDPRYNRIKASPSSHHAPSPLVKQEAGIKAEPGVEVQERDRRYARDPSLIMGASIPHHRESLRVSTPPAVMMPPEIDTSEFVNADDDELAARIEAEERAMKLQAMRQEMAKRNKIKAPNGNA